MKGGQIEMELDRTGRRFTGEYPASDDGGGEGFCPECGQSLDLTRHKKVLAKRRTLEPYIFLIFGLCLLVVFGTRAWNGHLEFSSVDQQIAALRVSTLTSKVDDTMGEVLEQQRNLQLDFQQDITGLGLGLFTLVVGSVSCLRERPEAVEGRRKRLIAQRLVSSGRPRAGGSLWVPVELVAITIARMLLLIFVTIIGLQLLRGVPLSPQLVDQALTRTVAVVVSIVRFL